MLTKEKVLELCQYDQTTGHLYWIFGNNQTRQKPLVGSVTKHGYRRAKINGVNTMVHRVVFLIETGRWPEGPLDHINGDKLDNRFCNLREVTASQNNCNRPKAKNGTSLKKGVSYHDSTGKWRARITLQKRIVSLGLYENEEDAHAAYCKAAEQLHGDFASFE